MAIIAPSTADKIPVIATVTEFFSFTFSNSFFNSASSIAVDSLNSENCEWFTTVGSIWSNLCCRSLTPSITVSIFVSTATSLSSSVFAMYSCCSLIDKNNNAYPPSIFIVAQLGDLDRPLSRWLTIFFGNSVATHLTLILAASDQATIEACHASPAGRSPFCLLCIAPRALHSRTHLETGVLRYLQLFGKLSMEWCIEHLPPRLAAELRYYYRIPVVVKSPSSFHASIVPTVCVSLKLSDSKISTAVYPVLGPSSNASSS